MSEIFSLKFIIYPSGISWFHAISPALATIAYLIIALYVLTNGHPHEDAFILFTYSENLAAGNGIRYYEGGPPTEGATDFLWMVMLGTLKYLSIDVAVSAVILNSLGVAIISLIMQKLLWNNEKPFESIFFSVVLSFLLVISPISTASYGGFSTAFYSSIIAILFFIIYTIHSFWLIYLPLVGLFLGLLRPDGVIVGVAASLIGLYYAYKLGFLKIYLYMSLVAFCAGVTYFILRYYYFGYLLPLPLYVKSSDSSSLPGLNEHAYWAISNIYLIGGAGVAFLTVKNKINIIISSIPVALLFVALVFATQSQNIDHRFQAPGTILLFLIFSIFLGNYFFKKKYSIPIIAVVMLFSAAFYSYLGKASASITYLTNNDYINYFPHQLSRFTSDSVKIVLTEAGRMAFWASGEKYDLVGLNTPQFAIKKVTPDDIQALSPDVIFMHTAGTLSIDTSCPDMEPYCEMDFSSIDSARIENRFWGDVDFSVTRGPLVVYEFLRSNDKKYTIYLVRYGLEYSHLYAVKNDGHVDMSSFVGSLENSFDSNFWMSYFQTKKLL